MFKNRIDYKLINFAIFTLIIYLFYQTGNLWIGIFSTLMKIILPFFLAFGVAYALHPFVKYLQSRKLPKSLSVFIVLAILTGIGIFLVVLVVPLLFNQLGSLFNGIIAFLKEVSQDYDLQLGPLQDSLSTSFNDIILSLGKYVSDGAVNMIGVSLEYLSVGVIMISAAVYFLIDMDNIRSGVKRSLRRRSKKVLRYVALLDREMKKYLTGFLKVMIISLFEYGIAYLIIGHPNAILLGFLAMLSNLIPYFGGMLTNVVAAITAFVISPTLFFKTIIAFGICSSLDGYLINPIVYGKATEIHPIIVIGAVFAGGILFGILGIFISLPLAIFIITTIKYFKEDVIEKIGDIKENKKKEA